jgi:hypothetical protein
MSDIRVEALRDNYNTYRDNTWKFGTLGLAVLGWLMTSTEARNYLSNSLLVSIAISFTLVLAVISHWLVNYGLIKKNTQIIRELHAQNKTMSQAYKMYSLGFVRFILNALSITTLIAACISVLVSQHLDS